MTQEIYEMLKPFSGHLYTATYCQFIRLTDNKAKAELEEIYKKHFGMSGNILGGCNRCVLNALEKLGRDYFAYEKEMKQKAAEIEELVGQKTEPDKEVTDNKKVTKPKAKSATNKNNTKKTKK